MNKVFTCRLEENKAGTPLIVHENEYILSANIRLVLESKGLFPKRGYIYKESSRKYWENITQNTKGFSSHLKTVYRIVEGPAFLEGEIVYGL